MVENVLERMIFVASESDSGNSEREVAGYMTWTRMVDEEPEYNVVAKKIHGDESENENENENCGARMTVLLDWDMKYKAVGAQKVFVCARLFGHQLEVDMMTNA